MKASANNHRLPNAGFDAAHERDEVLSGQAALLKMLADACVAAASIGAQEQAESLRRSLRTFMPQYDGHLAHYVLALLDHKAYALAEQVLDEAPPDGPYRELVHCARGVFLLMNQRPGWQAIFEQLRDSAADPHARRMAAEWMALLGPDPMANPA
jgi:hypothetical protein